MSDITEYNTTQEEPKKTSQTEETTVTAAEQPLSLRYVLEQIEKIAAQTDYLHYALQALEKYTPVAGGASKAEAIADVVKCRETTNQQMLRLYEKMYDDLKPIRHMD